VDDKIKKLTELKGQRQIIDDHIAKLNADIKQEMDAILRKGKPRKRKEPDKQLSLIK
jgi:hypothetical protein